MVLLSCCNIYVWCCSCVAIYKQVWCCPCVAINKYGVALVLQYKYGVALVLQHNVIVLLFKLKEIACALGLTHDHAEQSNPCFDT